jgi:hypothetical protein
MKKMTPKLMATAEMIKMNLSISIANGVSTASAEDAKLAIYPITVESPVLKQIPVPSPAVQLVPKKATFLDSKIFLVGSAAVSIMMSSDSPVREALLTFISFDL